MKQSVLEVPRSSVKTTLIFIGPGDEDTVKTLPTDNRLALMMIAFVEHELSI